MNGLLLLDVIFQVSTGYILHSKHKKRVHMQRTETRDSHAIYVSVTKAASFTQTVRMNSLKLSVICLLTHHILSPNESVDCYTRESLPSC
jgi:hypothetical protein